MTKVQGSQSLEQMMSCIHLSSAAEWMVDGIKAGLCLQQQQQQKADAPSVVWDAGAESRREGQQCRGDAGSRVTASWCPPVGKSA